MFSDQELSLSFCLLTPQGHDLLSSAADPSLLLGGLGRGFGTGITSFGDTGVRKATNVNVDGF